MKCYRCGAVMSRSPYEKSYLYLCQQCSGVWIDGFQFYEVLGGTPDLPEPLQKESRTCPRCKNSTFYSIHYPAAEVEIDLCDHCWGIWLDPGELQAIRAAMRGESPVQPEAGPASARVCSWVNGAIAQLLKW